MLEVRQSLKFHFGVTYKHKLKPDANIFFVHESFLPFVADVKHTLAVTHTCAMKRWMCLIEQIQTD